MITIIGLIWMLMGSILCTLALAWENIKTNDSFDADKCSKVMISYLIFGPICFLILWRKIRADLHKIRSVKNES